MKILFCSFIFFLLIFSSVKAQSGSYDIYEVNVNTGTVQRITSLNDADEYNPSFSNNGKQVAHDVLGVAYPFGHSIYITDITSGVSTLLIGAEGGNDASWSPNGNYIAFDCAPTGDASIYIVPSTGGVRTLIRANAFDAEWSNNSKRLVFTDAVDYYLRTIDLNGESETILGVQGFNSSWSPNGKYIAYSDGNSLYTIAVNEFGLAQGNPQQITFDGPDVYNQQPTWSNNSKYIVFHSNREVWWDFDIWMVSATGNNFSRLTGLLDQGDYDPCYSKNGEYVAFAGFTSEDFPFSKNRIKNSFLNSSTNNSIPTMYVLDQNHPNPFNPTTTIKYSVPQTSQVQIKVFDVLGNEIEKLVSEEKSIGTYELTWNAANLPGGIYFCQLKAGEFIETKKMILLK